MDYVSTLPQDNEKYASMKNDLFQKPDIIEMIRKILMWARHAWRKEGLFIRTVIKENPFGKRSLGTPRLRWEDHVKEDIKFFEMDNPEIYIKVDGMQRSSAEELISTFLKKMTWKPNETVLDFGCGPGDLTSDILYPILKKNIKLLVGVDISRQMIEYAKKTYECPEIAFKVLDIENTNVIKYKFYYNKIFSFFCFHWVQNKLVALTKLYSMLDSKGEILINFLLKNPFLEFYNNIDAEWQTYVKDAALIMKYSPEELKDIFIKAGFRIVSIE